MRLCLQFGATQSELRQRLTVVELQQWYAFSELEPWGDARADARIAVMGSAVCASMGAKVRPHDLIPQWGQQSNRMTLADWKAFVNEHNQRASGSK
jgi:hypothetical protein